MMDAAPGIDINRLMANGDHLRAFDAAQQAIAQGNASPLLWHQMILSLARSGAVHRAIDLYRQLPDDIFRRDGMTPRLASDLKALWARLCKDLALTTGDGGSAALLAEAAAAYETVFDETGGAYPACNAASLWLLADDAARAQRLARSTLAVSQAEPGPPDYWRHATRAEAFLVLGDQNAATLQLRQAATLGGDDFAALASTRQQLARVCRAQSIDPAILSALRPPGILHFSGHMIGESFPAEREEETRVAIAEALRRHDVGFGFGSLAGGADVLFAEELIRRGAKLHLFLPFDIDEFKAVSVSNQGPGWMDRFQACLEQASQVTFTTGDRYLGDDSLFLYCTRVAIGFTMLRARALGAHALQISVWDGQAASPGKAAGTTADIALWRSHGLPAETIDPHTGAITPVTAAFDRTVPTDQVGRRTPKAMIFGDVKGFSKLREEAIPTFCAQVLGRFAQVLKDFGPAILHRNTWGDAIYVVVTDAETAAAVVVRLQKAMHDIPFADIGLPSDMGVRLGCHFAPVFSLYDPVIDQPAFMGAHVSRTARIEPITPVGSIYVTEEFAAELSAGPAAGSFQLEYVGEVPAAKNYGLLRMYSMRSLPDR